MARHRDFDAARAEHAGEPLTFTLGGPDTYLFTAVADIPAGPLLDLAAKADLEDAAAITAFGDFIYSIVIPDDREPLRAALQTIGFAALFEVVQWIIQEATGRPLPQASSSPESQSKDGAPSRVVSLSPVNQETRSA